MEDFGHACSPKKTHRKNHGHNLPPADVKLPPHSQVRSNKKKGAVWTQYLRMNRLGSESACFLTWSREVWNFSLPPIAEANKAELKPSPILAFPIFSPIQVPGLNSTLYLLQQPDMPAKNHPHIFPSTWGETCSPLSIQKAKQVVICEPKTWENKWLSCCTSDYSTQLVT